jgi:hypothetical protein
METQAAIRERALRMAIATGEMPEVDFIWTVQKAEGNQACFGHIASCSSSECRWRKHCVALNAYAVKMPKGPGFQLEPPQYPSRRNVG